MNFRRVLCSFLMAGGLVMTGGNSAGAQKSHRNVDGAEIPFDDNAMNVLWEGNTTWITFGDAVYRERDKALEMSQAAAIIVMRDLMLTRAFKPERMESIPGHGWRAVGKLVEGNVVLQGGATEPRAIKLPDGKWRGICMFQMDKAKYSLDYVRRNAKLK